MLPLIKEKSNGIGWKGDITIEVGKWIKRKGDRDKGGGGGKGASKGRGGIGMHLI